MSYTSVNTYRTVGAHSQVAAADPRQLIAVMFESALARLATARGCVERGEVAAKGENISKAIGIIGGLNDSLDLEQGGQVARNLRELYDYSCRRLAEANLHNEVQGLDEVSSLLREIKSAWDALPQ